MSIIVRFLIDKAKDIRAASLQQVASRGGLFGSMAESQLSRLKEKSSDKRLEHLVEQAYSPNKQIRRVAEIKLRENYPSVWHEMDLAPQRQNITITNVTKTPTVKPKKKTTSKK